MLMKNTDYSDGPTEGTKIVAIPVIDRLPDDPEWDKVEEAFGRHASKRLPVPEE
jgi:hypothetical protein